MTIIVSIMLKNEGDAGFEDPLIMENLLVAGADALYYNSVLTMNALQQNGHLAYFMQALGVAVTKRKKKSGRLYHFSSKRFKKTVLLGLASLMATPAEAMPPGILQSIPQIAAAETTLLSDLKKQEDARHPSAPEQQLAPAQDYLSDSDNEHGSDSDEGIDDFMSRLRHLRGSRMGSGGYEEDDDEECDFDFFDDSDDDEDVKSPLDDISPYVVFRDACLYLQANNTDVFMNSIQLLDDEGKASLEQFMKYT